MWMGTQKRLLNMQSVSAFGARSTKHIYANTLATLIHSLRLKQLSAFSSSILWSYFEREISVKLAKSLLQ